MLRGVILSLLIVVGFSSSIYAAELKNIIAVSEEWEGGTNSDGSGFYWELLDLVYERDGIKVEKEVMPYERAVNMVKNNKADLWVGSYIDEEEFALYPRTAMDADIVAAVFRKGELDISKGESELSGKKVGWIRGYDYDSYIKVPMQSVELKSRAGGIRMVDGKRLDVFLDAKSEIELELKRESIDTSNLEIGKMLELKLFAAFADTPKGKELAKIWDDRLEELHSSGELKAFYDKHGYASYYPF